MPCHALALLSQSLPCHAIAMQIYALAFLAFGCHALATHFYASADLGHPGPCSTFASRSVCFPFLGCATRGLSLPCLSDAFHSLSPPGCAFADRRLATQIYAMPLPCGSRPITAWLCRAIAQNQSFWISSHTKVPIQVVIPLCNDLTIVLLPTLKYRAASLPEQKTLPDSTWRTAFLWL